jgi:hypothetical protein
MFTTRAGRSVAAEGRGDAEGVDRAPSVQFGAVENELVSGGNEAESADADQRAISVDFGGAPRNQRLQRLVHARLVEARWRC